MSQHSFTAMLLTLLAVLRGVCDSKSRSCFQSCLRDEGKVEGVAAEGSLVIRKHPRAAGCGKKEASSYAIFTSVKGIGYGPMNTVSFTSMKCLGRGRVPSRAPR